MAGLNVDITADTRQFQAQVDDVPASLQKISDELNDVTKAGDKTGSSLESNLRKAQEASEQTQTVFKEQTRSVSQGFDQQTEHAALSQREINSIQKESLKTTGASLSQTVEQSAQAYDGTVNGALNAVQNIATGVAALSGNAILAAGAGGIALLVAGIAGAVSGAQEQTKEFKQDVSDLTGELIDAGNTGSRSISAMTEDIKKLATETDDSKDSLSKLSAIAKELKVPLSDVVYAYEQGGTALDDLIKKNSDLGDAYGRQAHQIDTVNGKDSEHYGLLVAKADKADKYNKILDDQQKKLEAAATADQLAAQAGLTDYAEKATLLKQVDQGYDDAAGSVSDYVNKESGLFDVKAYIKAMQAKQKALADYQRDLVTSGLSPEAKSFLESQGADAAATLLAGYEKSSNADKTQLAQIWTTAGQASGGAYVDALSNTLPSTIKGPKIVPTIDLTSVQKSLRTLDNYPIVIKAKKKFGSDGI